MSLERVIAEQQKEIDRLRELLNSANNNNALTHKMLNDKFLQLDSLVSLRIRDCWRDDKGEQWAQYCKIIGDVKISMIENGWCFNCQSFSCECNWPEE